jgi:hypothetical protein
MRSRTIAFIGLTVLHLACYLAATNGIGVLQPVVATSIFGPLRLMSAAGLPVLASMPSGGWATPTIVGWALIVGMWLIIWYGVASAFDFFFQADQTPM